MQTTISTTALIPTNAQTKTRKLRPFMSPCTYSVFPKSSTRALMKKAVLRKAEKKPARKQAGRAPGFLSKRRNSAPTRRPSRARGTKRWINARKGSMLNSMTPMPLGTPTPTHWRKLSSPKTQPMASPPMGPRAMAAMAMGITFRVMESGPMGMVPMGVKEKRISSAVIRPRIAKARTSNFLFIFHYLLLPLPVTEDAAQLYFTGRRFPACVSQAPKGDARRRRKRAPLRPGWTAGPLYHVFRRMQERFFHLRLPFSPAGGIICSIPSNGR